MKNDTVESFVERKSKLMEKYAKAKVEMLKSRTFADEEDLKQDALVAILSYIRQNPCNLNTIDTHMNIIGQRSMDKCIKKVNNEDAISYDAPIAPCGPRLKDILSDERSEYDMMIDREYSNGLMDTRFMCADDRKFLNMVAYASAEEISEALNISAQSVPYVMKSIRDSLNLDYGSHDELVNGRFLTDSHPSALGYRYLYENSDSFRKFIDHSAARKTYFEISYLNYDLKPYERNEYYAKCANVSRQAIDAHEDTIVDFVRQPIYVEILQNSKETEIVR